MDFLPLAAVARDPAAKASRLRSGGIVPGVLYGATEGTLLVQCDRGELHRTFQKAGESTLVELDVGGKKIPVLFKELQFDPITDREVHADFYAVNMKKEIETLVPIRLEGESPAVKEEGAILVVAHGEVRVRCLPADLPHSLTVSIAVLRKFHDVVTVKDIALPKGVRVMEDPSTVIATVQEPRKEEEIAPPTAATTAEGEAAAGTEGTTATAEGGAAGAGAVGTPPAVGKAEEKGGKKEKK